MLLNDLAWITFTAPVGTMVGQNVCLALAVSLDKRAVPVFPRWIAPFSIVTAVAIAPAVGAAVFTTGPLAWNGLISFWVRLGAFFINTVVMLFVLRRAIKQEEREDAELVRVPVAVP